MAKLDRPCIVAGNDTTLYIRLREFIEGEYVDFDLTQVSDLKVELLCAKDNYNYEIPYKIDTTYKNLIICDLKHTYYHSNTSYGIRVTGTNEDGKHWTWCMMPREGFLVVSNTSGLHLTDETEQLSYNGLVGWGISYNGDLTNYYTKSEVDNLIAEIEIDLSDYYTKEEINQLVNQFPTKSEIDARFNNYYTKAEVNGLISDLEDIVDDKQDTLVSGVNIKTINNESILGSGNIDIQGGGGSVEPIILQYGQTISDETMSKIVEQKTNIWLKYGVNSLYSLAKIINYDNTSPALGFINNTNIYDNNNNTTGQIQISIISYVFHRWTIDTYILDDHTKIEKLFNEQFKTTADALWDLDHRINKNEYITNKKLESIENSTKDTLDEFGDNINEQLSVAANTLIEHSERLAVQSDWNESDTTSLAYIQNKPTISTPVQSDWNETDTTSLAYIQNKPTISEPKSKYYVDIYWENWPKNTTWQGEHAIRFGRIRLIDTTTGTTVYQAALNGYSNSLSNILNTLYNTYHIRADIYVDDMSIDASNLTFTQWNSYYLMYLPQQINNVDNGSILMFRFYERDASFNLVNYCNDVLIPIMPGKGRLVSSSTAGLKIEVVSALPASPDANTIYIVQ